MVDSNIQREELLISEKSNLLIKMKYEGAKASGETV